jgi:hypothetical protein
MTIAVPNLIRKYSATSTKSNGLKLLMSQQKRDGTAIVWLRHFALQSILGNVAFRHRSSTHSSALSSAQRHHLFVVESSHVFTTRPRQVLRHLNLSSSHPVGLKLRIVDLSSVACARSLNSRARQYRWPSASRNEIRSSNC